MQRVDLRSKDNRSVDNKALWYVHNSKVYDFLLDIPQDVNPDEVVIAVTDSSFNGSLMQWRVYVRNNVRKYLKTQLEK